MSLFLKDRVKQSTYTEGTGDIVLSATIDGYQPFHDVLASGMNIYYCVTSPANTAPYEWEVGRGAFISDGETHRIVRVEVLESSAPGDAKLSLSTGYKEVFITVPGEKTVFLDADDDLSVDTGSIPEGSNLYYSEERLNDYLLGGTGVTYSTGEISIGQSVGTTDDVTFNTVTGNVTGNSDTATALQTARSIAGHSFDGTADITIAASDLSDVDQALSTTSDVTFSNITSTGTVTLSADPTNALEAATKQYVDTLSTSGIHYHEPVRVETAVALNGYTHDNGVLTNTDPAQEALVIDGVAVEVGDRVLVYKQSNTPHNGVYTVVDTGSPTTDWVLERSTDANTYGIGDPQALGQGDAFFVKEGNTGAGELYVMNTEGEIILGTTPISFTVMAETAVYKAGTGIDLTGTTFSIGQDVTTTAAPTFAGATYTGDVSFSGANLELNDNTLFFHGDQSSYVYPNTSSGQLTIGNFSTGGIDLSSPVVNLIATGSSNYVSLFSNGVHAGPALHANGTLSVDYQMNGGSFDYWYYNVARSSASKSSLQIEHEICGQFEDLAILKLSSIYDDTNFYQGGTAYPGTLYNVVSADSFHSSFKSVSTSGTINEHAEVVEVTMTGDITINPLNMYPQQAGKVSSVLYKFLNPSGFTITWPSSTVWLNNDGTAPSFTGDHMTVVMYLEGNPPSTNIRAALVGNY